MGGIACIIVHNALVKFATVPSTPVQQAELELQLRACLANPIVAEAIAVDPDEGWKKICDTLAKPSPLNLVDLTFLFETAAEYASYT